MPYQSKLLIKFKDKEAGKNRSSVDGFYRDPDGNEYFIKKPSDKCELFAELFAGLLLKQFINEGLIDKDYCPSLICADAIQFEEGTYGLIQPLISFNELHKAIGTSYSNGNDRNPLKEAVYGPDYYTQVMQGNAYFGLSLVLMYSLLFSAHSVHSGNIIILKNKDVIASNQYGRIDWGDAFRYLAHPQNNDNILYAYENRGLFNIKKLTKEYFLNYKKIIGIYPAMAEKARQLQDKMTPNLMLKMVTNALKLTPHDLLDTTTRTNFANYISMPSFEKVIFGFNGNYEPFAQEFADLLTARLAKITDLKDLNVQEAQENLYKSTIVLPSITLSFNEKEAFPAIMDNWEKKLTKTNDGRTLDISNLDLSTLAEHYNCYLNEIAEQCEQSNIWDHTDDSANMFQPFDFSNGALIHGHAFISSYKESTVLRRLFSINPSNLNLSRFAAFEDPSNDYSKKYPESVWHKLELLLVTGQGVSISIQF
ncbi:hypothetical protein TUM19329_23730 [Legionella antarctica]|uniref:Uncharacterized protein n=1 Tax=Legionella antarctica TaxID=2708020 RepID=A0A6F8T7K4_9GAMM|nr:hypothetical protein [Legionella antarctica]BCA96012.1 hypothetical protein TUM19329_23730 [Legionella antarctica]